MLHAGEFDSFDELFAAVDRTGVRYVVTRFFDAVTFSGAGGDVVVVTEDVASVVENVGARNMQGHASLRSIRVGDRHYFLSLRDPGYLPRGWASAILDRRVRWGGERSADGISGPAFFVPCPSDGK